MRLYVTPTEEKTFVVDHMQIAPHEGMRILNNGMFYRLEHSYYDNDGNCWKSGAVNLTLKALKVV